MSPVSIQKISIGLSMLGLRFSKRLLLSSMAEGAADPEMELAIARYYYVLGGAIETFSSLLFPE